MVRVCQHIFGCEERMTHSKVSPSSLCQTKWTDKHTERKKRKKVDQEGGGLPHAAPNHLLLTLFTRFNIKFNEERNDLWLRKNSILGESQSKTMATDNAHFRPYILYFGYSRLQDNVHWLTPPPKRPWTLSVAMFLLWLSPYWRSTSWSFKGEE